MAKLRAILFDLDGTLIDSADDLARAVNLTLSEFALPLRELSEVRGMIGDGARELVRRALGPAHEHLLDQARERFYAHYASGLTLNTRTYAGVAEAIAALRAQGLLLGVATNKPSAFAGPILSGLGLQAAGISVTASADEVEAPKPNPAVLALALRRLDPALGPEQVAYVGDMRVDMQAARAFGAQAVAALWGFRGDEVLQEGPDRRLNSPSELLTLAPS